jgi:hypothetical protein
MLLGEQMIPSPANSASLVATDFIEFVSPEALTPTLNIPASISPPPQLPPQTIILRI